MIAVLGQSKVSGFFGKRYVLWLLGILLARLFPIAPYGSEKQDAFWTKGNMFCVWVCYLTIDEPIKRV